MDKVEVIRTVRQQLKWVLSDPERLKPSKTRQALTEQAAAEFAKLAQRPRERGHPSETVAHFINRFVFCMFAEDVDLLPNKMFKRMLEHTIARPEEFETSRWSHRHCPQDRADRAAASRLSRSGIATARAVSIPLAWCCLARQPSRLPDAFRAEPSRANPRERFRDRLR